MALTAHLARVIFSAFGPKVTGFGIGKRVWHKARGRKIAYRNGIAAVAGLPGALYQQAGLGRDGQQFDRPSRCDVQTVGDQATADMGMGHCQHDDLPQSARSTTGRDLGGGAFGIAAQSLLLIEMMTCAERHGLQP